MHKNKNIPVLSTSKTFFLKDIICEIVHLDPAVPNIKACIKIGENGSILLNKVCENFGGILEKDYFGLKYVDKHGQSQWLEMNKSISKQIKEKSHGPWIQLFSFRFKHYPKDPMNDLHQDLTRYFLYLQLRQDLYYGRLLLPQTDQYRMAALILQAESEGYMLDTDSTSLAELKILPSLKHKDEIKILSMYENFKDLDSYEAEKIFLQEMSKLDTYGVERVAVKDQKENDIFVGISFEGVSTFTENKKLHTFSWSNILKLSFAHKLFMIKVIVDKKKHILGFQCESSHAACALWKLALDRKWFITLDRATEATQSRSGGSLFRRKKSHTFSGRSLRELSTNCQTLKAMPQPHVSRTHSMTMLMKCNSSRSESVPVSDNRISNGSTGYSTLPLSQEEHSLFSESSEDGDFTKRNVKENILHNKPSSASNGTMLEFMEALRETPIPENESIKGSVTELNVQDCISGESVGNNVDDENTVISEMIEMVESQQENMLLNLAPSANALEAQPGDTCDKKEDPKASLANISILVMCVSVLLGIVSFLYVKSIDRSL